MDKCNIFPPIFFPSENEFDLFPFFPPDVCSFFYPRPPGACTDFIQLYCSKVQRGDSALAECLRDRIEEEESGDAKGRKVTKACSDEVDAFFIDRR